MVFLQNCICNRSHFQCLPPTRCPSGRRRSAGPSRQGSGSTARTSTASRARKLAPGEFCNILDILYYESLLLNQLLNSPKKGPLGSLSSFTTFGRRRSATMCLQTGTCSTISTKSTMFSGCVLKMCLEPGTSTMCTKSVLTMCTGCVLKMCTNDVFAQL